MKYVNDIDQGISCQISKFADATKIIGKVTTTHDTETLLSDLDRFIYWYNEWQMEFNSDKWNILHIGSHNDCFQYLVNGREISAVYNEKDLDVIKASNLKSSEHCSERINTVNILVGFIGRAFEYKSENGILILYNSMVRRPHS